METFETYEGCLNAHYDDGRYTCAVSGDGCIFMIPNNKRCAEEGYID